MRSISLLLILAAEVPALCRAAEPSVPDLVLAEASGLAGNVMFIDSGAPCMVLALVRGDRGLVIGYGETEKCNKRKPEGNSLLCLNSITKVFTTDVLVSLVAEGGLRLTDPLQRNAGEVQVPAAGTRQITLLDLATHSAGLPRDMGDSPPDAHPRAWPTREERWKWLPGQPLSRSPGTIAAYSDIGFALLSDASETAGSQRYSALLAARVTTPLGMVDTGFAPRPGQCERLMTGSGLGGAAACVDTHATQGSGGLYSTGDDMARWLHHNPVDPDGTLMQAHAIYRQRQSRPAAIGFDEAGAMAGLGLGWVTVAPVDEMKCRWIYSELGSPKWREAYIQLRGSAPLSEKARLHIAFSSLPPVETDQLLAYAPSSSRRGLVGRLNNHSDYRLAQQDKRQIRATRTIHAYGSVPYDEVLAQEGVPGEGATDVRVAAEAQPYYPGVWEAGMAVGEPRNYMLLDGYTRSVVFMKKAPPDATFAIWVPNEELF